MQPTHLLTGAGTDRGRQRTSNEDAYLCLPEAGIFAVIDGVGGYAGGEVAAAEAREAIRRRLEHRTGTPEARLREAVTNANNAIYWRSREDLELAGMACVLTVVLLEGGRLLAAHVGDTRLYKIRDHHIQKLTRDHSFVGVREDRAELSEYEAMHHPRRNEILRDVGSELHEPDDDHFIDLVEATFEPDAALLLCTDGLTDLVPARALQSLVYEHAGNPQAAAEALIHAANEAGGKDNVTVVVVEGPGFGAPIPRPRPMAEDSVSWMDESNAPAAPPPSPGLPVPRDPPRSAWRYYGYGVATVLGLLAVAYVAWTLWFAHPVMRSPEGVPLLSSGTDTTHANPINRLLARASPGDTVTIAPGTYAGTVRLRDGVTLRSAEPGGARIVPAPGDTVAVLAEHITHAALAGFDIGPTAAGDSFAVGILIRHAAVHVDHTSITGTTRAGVDIAAETTSPYEVVLQNSVVSGNAGAGVVVRRAPGRTRIVDNQIRSNGGDGLLARHADLDVHGNTITGNGGDGIAIRLRPDTTEARLRLLNTFTQDSTANRGRDVRVVVGDH